ncbi:MAG: glycosyltransferase family 2 protein [Pyrinomonadaceae bacterium]
MGQGLVSIIIPTFNRAHMVVDAIKSAIAQTYEQTQIIVIDDGSQDATAELVAEFPSVEYFYQENKGQAAARNSGLALAKGQYIASLDSDDVWDVDFLKSAISAIERYEVDFVFLNWREVVKGANASSDFERNKALRNYYKNSGDSWSQLMPKDLRTLFLSGCIAPSSAIVARRSSFFSNWNEKMKIGDDWYLMLEMVLMKPCRAAFTHVPHWTKNVHTSNIYHGRDDFEIVRDLGLHDEVIMAQDFHEQLTWREKAILKRRLSAHYFNFGRYSFKLYGFSLEVLRLMIRSIMLAPSGSVAYFFQLSFNHLTNRVRLAKERKRIITTSLAVETAASKENPVVAPSK